MRKSRVIKIRLTYISLLLLGFFFMILTICCLYVIQDVNTNPELKMTAEQLTQTKTYAKLGAWASGIATISCFGISFKIFCDYPV